ncbi:hypothetical protein F5B20DRAFT_11843 [Whalleya microplaca]|nr:hypothetical protein F5B20DRAFT_11843 [Whalleya microplaca]
MPPHSFAEWMVGRNVVYRPKPKKSRPVFNLELETDDESNSDILKVTYPRTGRANRAKGRSVRFAEDATQLANEVSLRHLPSSSESEVSTDDESSEDEETTDEEVSRDCPCTSCIRARRRLKKANQVKIKRRQKQNAESSEDTDNDTVAAVVHAKHVHAKHKAKKARQAELAKSRVNSSRRKRRAKGKKGRRVSDTDTDTDTGADTGTDTGTDAGTQTTDATETESESERENRKRQGKTKVIVRKKHNKRKPRSDSEVDATDATESGAESDTESDTESEAESEDESESESEADTTEAETEDQTDSEVEVRLRSKRSKNAKAKRGKKRGQAKARQPSGNQRVVQAEKKVVEEKPTDEHSFEAAMARLKELKMKDGYLPHHPPPSMRQGNFLLPPRSRVMQVEHAVEDNEDPRPNAFFDHENGIMRVYHGPAYGNPYGGLYPKRVYSQPLPVGTPHPPWNPYYNGFPTVAGQPAPPHVPPKSFPSPPAPAPAPERAPEENPWFQGWGSTTIGKEPDQKSSPVPDYTAGYDPKKWDEMFKQRESPTPKPAASTSDRGGESNVMPSIEISPEKKRQYEPRKSSHRHKSDYSSSGRNNRDKADPFDITDLSRSLRETMGETMARDNAAAKAREERNSNSITNSNRSGSKESSPVNLNGIAQGDASSWGRDASSWGRGSKSPSPPKAQESRKRDEEPVNLAQGSNEGSDYKANNKKSGGLDWTGLDWTSNDIPDPPGDDFADIGMDTNTNADAGSIDWDNFNKNNTNTNTDTNGGAWPNDNLPTGYWGTESNKEPSPPKSTASNSTSNNTDNNKSNSSNTTDNNNNNGTKDTKDTKNDKKDRNEKGEKGEKGDKSEKSEKSEKAEKVEKGERNEKSEKSHKNDKNDKRKHSKRKTSSPTGSPPPPPRHRHLPNNDSTTSVPGGWVSPTRSLSPSSQAGPDDNVGMPSGSRTKDKGKGKAKASVAASAEGGDDWGDSDDKKAGPSSRGNRGRGARRNRGGDDDGGVGDKSWGDAGAAQSSGGFFDKEEKELGKDGGSGW